MESKEYRTVDKSSWKRGPWDNEPDKAQWPDPTTSLPCLIVRGPSGALCGYVGVDESHPLYKVDYDNVDVEVHGGLTFASLCADTDDESKHICHVPGPGEPDHVWWLGFDCAHAWDLRPGYERRWRMGDEVYRDFEYVKAEVTSLASQLHAKRKEALEQNT